MRIVASTGFGPVWSIGSHFPGNVSFEGMTVDRMADILIREVTEGLEPGPADDAAAAGAGLSRSL